MVIPSVFFMQVGSGVLRADGIHAWKVIEGWGASRDGMCAHTRPSITLKWILGCTPRDTAITKKGEVSTLGLLSCCPRRLAHSNHNPRC